MNETIDIRPTDLSEPAEADAWLRLLDHYARDPMGGGRPLSGDARAHLVERLRSRPDFVGMLAWAGSDVVGLANAFEGFSTFAARPLLNLHDIVVRSDRRGRGIGQRLLRAMEAAARERGCCKLTLEVLSNNQRALASYRRFGFRDYQLDPDAGTARFMEKPIAT
ncbi:MAG: GNAT family N-acetyltransferase [Rhodocyclaceae bacterium]|nr:GNAT family N-acetyltransferase [Rhodocyclaceae bacterium]